MGSATSGVSRVIRSNCALFQVQIFPMDLNRVPGRSTKIQFVVLTVKSHVARGVETNNTGIYIRAAKRVIDEVIVRGIFVNATTERAIDTRVRVIMPGLSRLKSTEIDLIFARRTVGACFSRRLLEIAAGSIVEQK